MKPKPNANPNPNPDRNLRSDPAEEVRFCACDGCDEVFSTTNPRRRFCRTVNCNRIRNRPRAKERYHEKKQADPNYLLVVRRRTREAKRARLMGWSPERFNRFWQRQDGCCAHCGIAMRSEGTASDSVNADHAEYPEYPGLKFPRALLCQRCNSLEGTLASRPGFDEFSLYRSEWKARHQRELVAARAA